MSAAEDLVPRIAHDARALIRKGLSNAQYLERLLTPGLGPEATLHLRAIIESQVDLNHFFVRLVALNEAQKSSGRGRYLEEMVDLETAVLGADLEFREAFQRTGAELVVRQLPVCRVPGNTQTVLRELLDNSLRYRDEARALRVVIDADIDPDRVSVRVADNGTGVASAYLGKLFQPMQRLDAARSGFGFGLAIARETVSGAGGRIYAEPSDMGAQFVFELPNHADA